MSRELRREVDTIPSNRTSLEWKPIHSNSNGKPYIPSNRTSLEWKLLTHLKINHMLRF